MSFNSDKIGEFLSNDEGWHNYVSRGIRAKGKAATATDVFGQLSENKPKGLSSVTLSASACKQALREYF